ncbi:MAG: PorV/PorQ family protein [Bacteroidetes bacterium]|nr:PorV/PorQ family protein [Bacteroidota bacterium]
MKIKSTIFLSLFSIATLQSFGQAPKYSNEFLSIGVGARAMGMSGAVAASTSDATSAFWNPAGLTQITTDLQIAAMHAELFAGISKFDYATVTTHIDDSRIMGFSILRFGTDDIPNTLDLIDASGNVDYSKVTSFASADYAFMFSYAKKTSVPGLNIGGSAKVIHRKAGDFAKAWGFGFDLGAQYKMDKWLLGVQAKDVTSTFNSWSYNTDLFSSQFALTGNEIPKNSTEITLPKLIFGAGREFAFSSKISCLVELDADMTFDGQRNVLIGSDPVSIDPHLGFELGYNHFVFLRGGVQNIQKVKNYDGSSTTVMQPNLGLGIVLGKLSIDWAMANISQTQSILASNIFSLKLDISKHK